MSVNFKSLSERISVRYTEIKGCGANSEGGGGFRAGNTCARGGSESGSALIGKRAYPKDDSYYAAHVAYIKEYKGNGMYILAGGSLGSLEPLMHRSEFTVRREKKSK